KYCKNDQLTNAIDFRVSILSKFQLKFSNLSVWLPDDLNELTKRINRRIRMATTLNIEHGEELQVANYGLGGYYAPHYDYARRFEIDAYEKLHGNRIATTMIYI
ncbi:unnamed protein product, partial [Hymenolepis diminuta]